jgi:2-polyprenyl-3-methyl-5-hydroxy-6-metoxy-1,4-benzoquinol methylase
MASGKQRDIISRFRERYGTPQVEAALAVERDVIGANVGANGYTTLAQADGLVGLLGLKRGTRLLDIGAGRGWPGLYLAAKSGCEVVLADVPQTSLKSALARADEQRLGQLASCLRATGERLPFHAHSFDAITHTDTL